MNDNFTMDNHKLQFFVLKKKKKIITNEEIELKTIKGFSKSENNFDSLQFWF